MEGNKELMNISPAGVAHQREKSLPARCPRPDEGKVDGSQGGASDAMNIFMRREMGPRRSRAGFTLIELMIVVAIVAILAAIAYPSYTHYIIKTRRTAAKACLSQYANYMERFYTTNLTYALAPDPLMDCEGAGQTGNYYGYNSGTPTTNAYTLQAVPTTAQPDSECGTLGLNQTGARTATTTGCW
jgi:type IV pilus assembly protein PilE